MTEDRDRPLEQTPQEGAADQAAPSQPQPDGGGAPQGAAGDEGQPEQREESTPEQDELIVTKMALEERTADLQRLQAEFLNYKRRVERDRELIKQNATYSVLAPITDVLDTIDRAREHGPLDGGLKAVADQLERIVASLGLTKFGKVGDPFDPSLHEALSHIGEDPEVDVTTCKVIAKAGYRIGDRVVRAAQVLVVDPASTPAQPVADEGSVDGSEPAQAAEASEASEAGRAQADEPATDEK